MRKLNWQGLILDLIYIALGVIFIIRPDGVESVLCYILAAAVAVFGLLYLLGYFIQKTDETGQREGNGFALGVLLIIMAVFVVVKQKLVISLVPFLFGLMVMIRGLMVIQNLFVMRRMGFKIGIPLISGLLTMGFGLFVMLFPFETATMLFILIGIGLIIGGITGILQEVLVWSMSRKQFHEEERARDMEGAQTIQVYEGEADADIEDAPAEEAVVEKAAAEEPAAEVSDAASDAKAGQAEVVDTEQKEVRNEEAPAVKEEKE